MQCPLCKHEIEIEGVSRPIANELGPLVSLKKYVQREALINAEKQGLLKDQRLANPEDDFYNKPQAYALFRTAFYMCNGCEKPYFGGLIDCMQEN